MSSEILKNDQNYRRVGGAVTGDASQDVTMLRVDPITGYLLVDLSPVGATSANASEIASRDENYRTTCLAWDETNEVLQEVLTDVDGNLLVDIEFI